jgi:hypothetical protein
MWEFLNKILSYKITPNQCLLLFAVKQKVRPATYDVNDLKHLIESGYITKEDTSYKISIEGAKIIRNLNSYFERQKKKTAAELMGKDYANYVKQYREIFPAQKLPSGVPARNNVKILTENFRWFFTEFEYSWDEVIEATKHYVNEFRLKDYKYMQNSQFFISKQDKHKVKTSKLADYCDLIKDGVDPEDNFYFKDRVV